MSENFRKVRLTRTKKAGNPDAHHVARRPAASERLANLCKCVEDALQLRFDLVCYDIFANFRGE